MRRVIGNLTSANANKPVTFTLVNRYGFKNELGSLALDVYSTQTAANGDFSIELEPNVNAQKYAVSCDELSGFIYVPQGVGDISFTLLTTPTQSQALASYITNIDGVETAAETLLRAIDASFCGGWLSQEESKIKEMWLAWEDRRWVAPLSLYDPLYEAIDRGFGQIINKEAELWRRV